ncbi:hypothetical protein BGS_0357 [Beggiatoa sp. SS]|nr:hypothetical protein BGS_0357 [Beggiatoa sp. SS]
MSLFITPFLSFFHSPHHFFVILFLLFLLANSVIVRHLEKLRGNLNIRLDIENFMFHLVTFIPFNHRFHRHTQFLQLIFQVIKGL